MKIEGTERLKAKLLAARLGVERRVHAAAGHAAEDLVDSTAPFVPIEWGNLRGSGRVEKLGEGDYAAVYGGAEAPYAIYVHERLDLDHDPPTKAKFLETTYLANKQRYSDYILDQARKGLND